MANLGESLAVYDCVLREMYTVPPSAMSIPKLNMPAWYGFIVSPSPLISIALTTPEMTLGEAKRGEKGESEKVESEKNTSAY